MDRKTLIAQMSDSDLATQLKSLKEDLGPITPSTRPMHERRLMKYLILDEAASCSIPYTPAKMDDKCLSEPLEKNVKHENVSRQTNESVVDVPNDSEVLVDSTDAVIFYGVQLQECSGENG